MQCVSTAIDVKILTVKVGNVIRFPDDERRSDTLESSVGASPYDLLAAPPRADESAAAETGRGGGGPRGDPGGGGRGGGPRGLGHRLADELAVHEASEDTPAPSVGHRAVLGVDGDAADARAPRRAGETAAAGQITADPNVEVAVARRHVEAIQELGEGLGGAVEAGFGQAHG